MSSEQLKRLLNQPENIRLEFKEARKALPKNLFETICSMLNRDGGDILLGVDDSGTVKGIESSSVKKLMSDIVNLSNNTQKLDPPFILFPQHYEFMGNALIHIQVPTSSQVHKTTGIVFDRSNDGDFRVTQPHQIAAIFNNKRNHYTESIIYPAVKFSDFKRELFTKVRNLIKSNYPNHPWLALDDQQMLVKAGLWRRDPQHNDEGYTLAAILLLGNDELIQSTIPHYKIDALVRIKNILRFDDRAYIQTNLIDAYDKLMDFIAKHLPDKFYMENDQRVSLRDKIFREVVANLIVHREYTNARPCQLIIYEDRVESQNANNPHGEGPIDPKNFAPFPKNPAIAKFFMQLGRVEELGSGVLNVTRLIYHYTSRRDAKFIEGETFKTIIPIENKYSVEEHEALVHEPTVSYLHFLPDDFQSSFTEIVRKRLLEIVKIIYRNPGIKIPELLNYFDVSERTIKENLKVLTTAGIIFFKGSKKSGGYYIKPAR